MPKIKVNNPKNIIKGTPTRYYFKLHNTGGPKGDKGDTGDTGPQGPKGDTGNAATVQVGSTTTLPVGQDATVENVGNQYAAILNFGIPQGPQGPQGVKGDKGDTGDTGPQGATGAKGDPGTNATVYVGTTTTGNPGTQASVRNSGTENNAVLNFTIPQGATGAVGPANTLSIGSVTRGADASATITGDAPNQTLNLVLPKGDKGDTGATGAEGPRGPQGIQGETGEAFSIYKTYSSVADMNADASNVPEGKFTLIASNVDDPDNSKLFVKNGEGTFTYLTDMSGAQGIQGPAGPQGVRGDTGPVGPQGETGPRGSVKSQYVAELPASGDEDTFYLVDRDLESHAATGEYITLETTQTAAAIQSAQLNGNATQTTYSGKNLWNNASPSAMSSSATWTPNDNGGVFKNPNTWATGLVWNFELDTTKQYTVQLSIPSNLQFFFYVRSYTDNTYSTESTRIVQEARGNISKTFQPDTQYVRLFFWNGSAIADGVTIQNMMFEQSASASTFEPYVGGTPAPNPDYPQPISVVTGENVVKVVGKNLMPLLPDGTITTSQTLVNGVMTVRQMWAYNKELKSENGVLSGNPLENTGTYYIWYYRLDGLEPNTTYTLSLDYSITMQATGQNIIAEAIFSNMPVGINTGRVTKTITTDENGSYIPTQGQAGKALLNLAINNNQATYFELSNIQLELGSTATTYQAYTAQDYEVNLGKNLANFAENTSLPVPSSPVTIFDAGHDITGTYVLSLILNNAQYTNVNGTVVDFVESNGAHHYRTPAQFKDANGTAIPANTPTTGTYYKVESGTKFQKVNVYLVSGSYSKWTSGTISIQLELGQPTAYAPYFTPLELAKIGTYQDRIYKTDGKWYVEKQIGKITLNGSENWTKSSTFQGNYYVASGIQNGKVSTRDMMSNLTSTFVITQTELANSDNCILVELGGSGGRIIDFKVSSISTLADFKTFLSRTNLVLYYPLQTPTTTEITEQALIDQLEALASASLNQGVNNIWTEIATGNAMPTLELNWVEWQKYNKHNVYIWNNDIDDWQVIVQ